MGLSVQFSRAGFYLVIDEIEKTMQTFMIIAIWVAR